LQQQQQQGMCRAVAAGHSMSKRACDVQEALGKGMPEFTGLATDTWSIDSMTLSSLHLMSLQSRSRQRRTGPVKKSSPAELDAPFAPAALATPNNSGSCSWQTGRFAHHGGRREDSDIREFLHVVFGSASQNRSSNIAPRGRWPKEASPPATFTLSNSVQQNPETANSANTGPAFGAAVIINGVPPWEQTTVAVPEAVPRPHGIQ